MVNKHFRIKTLHGLLDELLPLLPHRRSRSSHSSLARWYAKVHDMLENTRDTFLCPHWPTPILQWLRWPPCQPMPGMEATLATRVDSQRRPFSLVAGAAWVDEWSRLICLVVSTGQHVLAGGNGDAPALCSVRRDASLCVVQTALRLWRHGGARC